MKSAWSIVCRLSFFAILLSSTSAVHAATADQIVFDTTREVLQRLESDKGQLESDPNHIKVIVRDLIVPHMDFNTMTELVIGDQWRYLDEQLKMCIVSGFRNLLVERYAYVLLAYRNQDISYQSAMPTGKEDYVSITQTLMRPDVKPLSIEYPMRPEGDSWKVIDLVIDDVSLVKSYRKMFRKKIRHQGIYGFAQSFSQCN